MIIKNELEIQELADLVQRTPQSIYDRLSKKDNKIHQYVVQGSQPVKLYKEVIKEVYNKDIETLENTEKTSTCSSTLTSDEKEEKSGNNENDVLYYKIKLLEDVIESQKKDIEKKDNTIADLTKLLDQQQQLSLLDRNKIAELEKKTLLLEESQEKKKWGILSLFHKKVKE